MPKRRHRRRRNKAGRALIIESLTRKQQTRTQSTEIDQTEPTKSSGARRGVVTKRKRTSLPTNTIAKRACTNISHAGITTSQQPETVSKVFETVLESFSKENSLDSGTLSDRLNSKHRFVSASIALCFVSRLQQLSSQLL